MQLPAKARLADHLLPGGLAQLIADERAKGSSFETIAKEIERATDRQVEVSSVSVMSWASMLGFPTSRIKRGEQAAS